MTQGDNTMNHRAFGRPSVGGRDPFFLFSLVSLLDRISPVIWLLASLALLSMASVPAAAKSMARADCSKLLDLKLKDTVITEAAVIPAAGEVPEHCRVQGGLETVILFEVSMPTSAWNGKLFYVGGAGYNGSVPELTDALARGYAAAGSDTAQRVPRRSGRRPTPGDVTGRPFCRPAVRGRLPRRAEFDRGVPAHDRE